MIQIKDTINSFCLELKHSLSQALIAIQSDQIISQMRNDPSLYDYKLQHIKQIISDIFNLQHNVGQVLAENFQLKKKINLLQENIKSQCKDFQTQLQNIEITSKQFIAEKENQKHQIETKHHRDMKNMTNQIKKLNDTIAKINDQLLQAKENLKKTESQKIKINDLKKQHESVLKKTCAQYELKIKLIQESKSSEIHQYQEIIQKMQKDMLTIKQTWERKCYQIETHLRDENNLLIIDYEGRLKRQLQKYVQSMNLGQSIVIQDSEELINCKMQMMESQYEKEFQKMSQQMNSMSKLADQCRRQIDNKNDEIRMLQSEISKWEINFNNKNKQLSEQIKRKDEYWQSENRKLEKIKQKISNLEASQEQIKKQNADLKESSSYQLKKISLLQNQNLQFKRQSEHLRKRVEDAKIQIQIQHKKNNQLKHQFSEKQDLLHQSNLENQKIKRDLQQSENLLSKKSQKLNMVQTENKNLKQKIKTISKNMQKLYLMIKKVQKQPELLKQHIKYLAEMIKTKHSCSFNGLNEQLHQIKQTIEKKYRSKMTDLLDQMEVNTLKDKQMIDAYCKEKDNLKSELKEYENTFERKQSQNLKLKRQIKELQKQNSYLQDLLRKQKQKTSSLQERILLHESNYQQNLNKAEREVFKTIQSFNDKWSQQISRLNHENERKDIKLRQIVQKLQLVLIQCDQLKKHYDNSQQEIKKYKKKYESMKEERDEKVEGLMKKLNQQSKHRISLQSELKSVRLTVMSSTNIPNNSYNNYSFNDKQPTSSKQNQYKTTTKDLHTHDREKQLSQIRQMIAKTYKVVANEQIHAQKQRDSWRGHTKR